MQHVSKARKDDLQKKLEKAIATIASPDDVVQLVDVLDQVGELSPELSASSGEACASALRVIAKNLGKDSEDLVKKLSTSAVTAGVSSSKLEMEARVVEKHASLLKCEQAVTAFDDVAAFCRSDKDDIQSRKLLSTWKDCGLSLEGLGEDLLAEMKSFQVLGSIVKESMKKRVAEIEGALNSLKGQALGGEDGASWKAELNDEPTWEEVTQASKALFKTQQKGSDLQNAFKKLHQAWL